MATNSGNGLHRSTGEGLSFDNSGFLVGQRRLEQSVKSVEENTHEILEFLKAQLKARELNPPEHQLSAFQKAIIEANRRTVIDTAAQVARQSSSRTAALSRPTRDTDQPINNSQSSGPVIRRRPTVDVNSPADIPARSASSTSDSSQNNSAQERTRDNNGRFSSGEGNEGTDGGSNWLERVKNSIQSGVKDGLHTDARGIDPTVDAINELGTLMSPVGKVAKFTLRPLGALFRGRKRSEPIPRDEERHNREQIRLLRRIAGGSNSGGSLLTRMLPMAMAAIAGIGAAITAGFAAAAPVIAAAITAYLASKAGNAVNEQLGKTETGRKIQDTFGKITARTLAFLGNKEAQEAVAANDKAEDAERYKNRPENPAWYSNDGVKRFARKFGIDGWLKEDEPVAAGKAASNRIAKGGTGGANKIIAPDASKIKGFDAGKAKRIAEVAGNVGIDPNDLAAIISFETAGTFSPSIKNPKSSATGLIQFMKGTGGTKGKYYGMDRDQFAGLSFDDQMAYVEKYYKDSGFDGKTQRSLADAYTAVTGYGYKKGSKEYDLNKAWDTDGNKYISKGEAVKNPKFKAHQRKYFENIPPSTDKPTDAPEPQLSSYNRLNTNPAKPTQQAAVIPLMANSARSAPQLAPIQPIPAVKEPLSSKAPQIVQLASSSDNIGQNVSDRDIAHGVTGGLGARTWDA